MAELTYYTLNTYQASWSTSNSTTKFNDGSAGDQTTYEEVTTLGIMDIMLTGFLDIGASSTISAYDVTIGTTMDLGGPWALEGSTDSTSWTSIQWIGETTLQGTGFERRQHSATGSYRYFRLSVKGQDDGSVGSKWVRIADFRITYVSASVRHPLSLTGVGR